MLNLSRKKSESLAILNNGVVIAVIHFDRIDGANVRLSCEGTPECEIYRTELITAQQDGPVVLGQTHARRKAG